MGILKIIVKSEADSPYLLNCFNYAVGGHTIPGMYGGININPENAYYQMMRVKEFFRKTGGNQLIHFVINFNNRVFDDKQALNLAYRIAEYFKDRYQIIFGIHQDVRYNKYGKAVAYFHTHLIMNSVSFIDGKMFADNKADTYKFVDYIKRITADMNWKVVYGREKKC